MNHRPRALAVVIWRDAYYDQNGMSIEEAVAGNREGVLLTTVGMLVEEDEASILIAKDWGVDDGFVRGLTRIRRCDVVALVTPSFNIDVEYGDLEVDAVEVGEASYVSWDRIFRMSHAGAA